MPLTTRRAMCIGKIRGLQAYVIVNMSSHVVSGTKMAIHMAGCMYSHFEHDDDGVSHRNDI